MGCWVVGLEDFIVSPSPVGPKWTYLDLLGVLGNRGLGLVWA